MNEEALARSATETERELSVLLNDTFCYEIKRADGLESINLFLPTLKSTGS